MKLGGYTLSTKKEKQKAEKGAKRNKVSTMSQKPSFHLLNIVSYSSFRIVPGSEVTFLRRPSQILLAPPAPGQVPF